MFDYSFLRGKIVEKVGTCKNLAKKMGIAYQNLSEKMQNKVFFTQIQIYQIKNILELSEAEVCRCFFVEKNSE